MVDIQQREPAKGGGERPELEIFRRQWTLYRKIIDNDYFHGADVYPVLHRYLKEEISGPFRFLDLACGDASGIVGALEGTRIAHYHGVDLSLPALELAERQLQTLPCAVMLEHADFTDAVKTQPHAPDVAWFGLSLHHLATPGKRGMMCDIRKLIAADGAFVIYEPTLRDGEDLPAYLDRFEKLARSTWTACSSEELVMALEHVRSCDLPETSGDWIRLGSDAGFSKAQELYRAPTDLFGMFAYRV